MKVFTGSECGVIGAWREDAAPFKVNLNYVKIPSLNNKIVIVADPMVATGNTMDMVLDEIKKIGAPKRLVLLTVISSEEGIKSLSKSKSNDFSLARFLLSVMSLLRCFIGSRRLSRPFLFSSSLFAK